MGDLVAPRAVLQAEVGENSLLENEHQLIGRPASIPVTVQIPVSRLSAALR